MPIDVSAALSAAPTAREATWTERDGQSVLTHATTEVRS